MRRAILTGFEPFGPYKYNPVQDTAMEYDGRRIGDVEVAGVVLPATYYGAFEVLSGEIDRLNPEIVLGTGLASRIPRLRLELVGRNIMSGKYPDADGRKPDNEPIVSGGKRYYFTNFDNVSFANVLYERGLPSDISVDAERFICNSLIYLTARRISDEALPVRFAFLHTPWTDDYLGRVDLEPGKTTIAKHDLRKAIEILLAEM